MVDLNHILLFIALVSPVLLLGRTWRNSMSASWRVPAFIVLAVTGAAFLLEPRRAGFIGGTAWLLLLFLPALIFRRALEFAAAGRFFKASALVQAMRLVHPARGVREHAEIVASFQAAQRCGAPPPFAVPPERRAFFGRQRGRLTRVVGIFIALNVAMFAAEILLGGSTSYLTLHHLGALEPFPVLMRHQYWRLLAALFLHYGALHLFLNVFALFFFGPTLENAIGSARFAFVYLVAGVGSCALVALLWKMNLLHADQLVGASGAVMGIVGAWAGTLLRSHHLPHARATLRNIGMIVAVQTVFDLITPQVSMAAHLGGLATGFVLGYLIAPKSARNAAV